MSESETSQFPATPATAPQAVQQANLQPPNPPADFTPAKKKRSLGKTLLMVSLPLALAAGGGWYWLNGGRIISTENAYVQQDKVPISPEISGRVAAVFVTADKPVKAGDKLFELDKSAFEIALAKTESAVSSARLQVEQMRTAWKQAKAGMETAKDKLAFQQSQFERQQKLRSTGINTVNEMDQSQHDVAQAQLELAETEARVSGALAALGGKPDIATDRHPVVLSALAAQEQARLDLKNTLVLAPADGLIAQASGLQTGEYVRAGSPVLAIVTTGKAWVEANFNETDLTNLKAGQKATLSLDAYPDVEFSGTVESIGAGTGATFSLLPAQNATGNWVKVVQRVPVRILIENAPEGELRTGLSVSVEVDTEHKRQLPAFAQNVLGWFGYTSSAQAAQ